MLGCGSITQVSFLLPPVVMLFPLQLTEKKHTHTLFRTRVAIQSVEKRKWPGKFYFCNLTDIWIFRTIVHLKSAVSWVIGLIPVMHFGVHLTLEVSCTHSHSSASCSGAKKWNKPLTLEKRNPLENAPWTHHIRPLSWLASSSHTHTHCNLPLFNL